MIINRCKIVKFLLIKQVNAGLFHHLKYMFYKNETMKDTNETKYNPFHPAHKLELKQKRNKKQ